MSEYVRPVGPVDILVVGFPEARFDGTIAPAILELVANGTVRLLDVLLVHRDESGDVMITEVTEIDESVGLGSLSPDIPGLIAEDDVEAIAAGLPPGSAVAVLAWENTWAVRASMALRRNGSVLLAHERIPAADVAAVLDALDAELV